MKKILVPTDFSDNALNAVNYAVAIAKILPAKITLLHTYQSPHPTGVLKSMDHILAEDAEKEMTAILKDLPAEIPVDHKSIKGDPVVVISRYSADFDLIVMGTQGASGLKEVFIGSVTGGVMRQTQTPVLAIPGGYRFQPIKNLGFAVANLQLYSTESAALVKELVQKTAARVFVFHQSVGIEGEVEVPSNLEWMGDIPYTVSIVSNEKGLDANIHDFVEKKEIGLLCMVRRKRNYTGFFERLFKDSVTLSHVFHCKIPLLILHSE
jgi:nucleotide-binding universal stress UspA family protein